MTEHERKCYAEEIYGKIGRMVSLFPEILILFLKRYFFKKNNTKAMRFFFFAWEEIIFFLNIHEMHQYWSNIDDESMTLLYKKPALDPNAPFDSAPLCL